MLKPAQAFVVSCLVGMVAACSKDPGAAGGPGKGGPSKGPTSFPVEVAAVESRRVEYTVNAVGSVDAFEQVQITARVAGAVETVRFVEGDRVKKGAVLVEIEPGRYQLAVRSAQATLERAQASKDDAQRSLTRREKMMAEGIASAEEIDSMRTKSATSSAEVSQAQASVALASLNLRDAYVRAPFEGTIQTRTVRTGQYVQAGTVLATLIQREPLLLRLQVPEHEAVPLKVGGQARFTVRGLDGTLTAELTHVSEAADPTTRMVQLVGKINSPPEGLRPGAFAEVSIPVGASLDAPVIPQTAVRPSERGFLSFVVEDGKAKERILKLGMRTAEGLVEVKSGVRPGEMLVVRGAEALKDGTLVKVSPGGAGASLGERSPPSKNPSGAPSAGPTASPVTPASAEGDAGAAARGAGSVDGGAGG
jgi:RND family efflux transporter MFP subunit